MNHVQIAADIVRHETSDDPEHLAGAAMCYVQSHVRPWRERERTAQGAGFTTWPDDILTSGSGYCGGAVHAWRAILREFGIASRQLNLGWKGYGHVVGEALWDARWHLFDVQNGTLWLADGEVLDWAAVRLNPDEGTYRVSNDLWARYGYQLDPDPFAYITVQPLRAEFVT